MRAPIAIAATAALLLCGCDQSQPQAASQDQRAASAPAPVEPPPSHHYAMEENGAYGYQQALSQDDINAGTATKPLVMMHYLGKRGDTYTIVLFQDENESVAERISCAEPCKFAKAQDVLNGQVLRTQTVPVPDSSIIGAMLKDAINGQLTPYRKNGAR